MSGAMHKNSPKRAIRSVFGPVRSGRLGASLGLDLLGARICSFDCLYCEVGKTEAKTTVRKPYVPASRVLDELSDYCAKNHPPFDVVTLGGQGEPTLNADMGEILAGAKKIAGGVPTAVLTNSAHLSDPGVRAELCLADIVLPSLDSLVPDEFSRLNQPHPDISLAGVLEGLLAFRSAFSGKIYLETLLCAGINDTRENLEALEVFSRRLRPDRVDVVTVSRPGAWPGAGAVSQETMERFRAALSPGAPSPHLAGHGPAALLGAAISGLSQDELEARALASLSRRPQTAGQLAGALGLDPAMTRRLLERLCGEGKILSREELDDVFYSG